MPFQALDCFSHLIFTAEEVRNNYYPYFISGKTEPPRLDNLPQVTPLVSSKHILVMDFGED